MNCISMKKAKEILKKLKLRPTLQRVAITEILLKKKEVHILENHIVY